MKRCLSMTLSLRGRRALKPLTSYFPAYLQAMERPWTNEDPEGSLALVVAENRLASSERIQSRIKEALCRVNQSESFFYSDYSGRPEFREALANHMSRNITRDTPFSADNLVVGNGCGAVLDTLFWLIGNEGDEVLIPSPTYPAFKNDLNVRDGLKTVMVAPHVDDPTYLPLPEQLEAATTSKTAALLLTNPSNPLGIVHCPVRMTELIQWAADRDMHVVVDEIYASSIYDPANAYSFDSAWDIAAKLKKEQQHLVHVVYGLSKDFGVSGVRVGCIASRNTDLLRAFRDNLGYFCTVCGITQEALTEVINDQPFVDSFLEENRQNLYRSYQLLTESLTKHGISFLPANSAMFLWVDLRDALRDGGDKWEAESHIFDLMCEEGILLTPGRDCKAVEPGFFRACWAAIPPEALPTAAERLSRVIERAKNGRFVHHLQSSCR